MPIKDDKTLTQQYKDYLSDVVHGQLGDAVRKVPGLYSAAGQAIADARDDAARLVGGQEAVDRGKAAREALKDGHPMDALGELAKVHIAQAKHIFIGEPSPEARLEPIVSAPSAKAPATRKPARS
jgi:hypothetical protein